MMGDVTVDCPCEAANNIKELKATHINKKLIKILKNKQTLKFSTVL